MILLNPKIKVYDNKVFITKTQEVELGNNQNISVLKQSLKIELSKIIGQVKALKVRAEEIKSTLKTLETSKQ